MLNLGLKGKQNVDVFNKTILRVSRIHPQSCLNTSTVPQWFGMNIMKEFIGRVMNVVRLIKSIIDDKGSLKESTQILLGQMCGTYAAAELGAVIGAQIGAAIGIIIPVWGSIIIGLIGGLIGNLVGKRIVQLARYLFCVAPASPGPGVPILDTDPYQTYTGIPDQGLNNNVYGVRDEEKDKGAFGIPSMGLDTGAFGTPESEHKTPKM